jgi:Nif-specific regulatory protein
MNMPALAIDRLPLALFAVSPTPAYLRALSELGRELAAGNFEQALGLLERYLGTSRSVLYLMDAGRRALRVEAAHGLDATMLRPQFGLGVAGRVAETGLPIVVPSVRFEPMALQELSDPRQWADGSWSLISVPIARAGRPCAALSAYFSGADDNHSSRLAALSFVASLMSQALETVRLQRELDPPTTTVAKAEARAARSAFEYANMIGSSALIRQVYEQVGQVAPTSATALIRGESGTGKELVAHAIHINSSRASGAFVKVNCAALPENLFESELFGHERGAFTGAVARKKGRFELAQGGTLFLDEIGDLPLSTQVKLLRVLQSREFERLGGTETLRADVRIITATNRDMERAVAAGQFREDLYYRLNVFTITMPPLRDRRADIPSLAEYFLAKYAKQHGRKIGRLSTAALDRLSEYGWPGNVRELENAIERAVVLCDGFVVEERHLPRSVLDRNQSASGDGETPNLTEAVERLERRMIQEALTLTRGNLSRAARALGITERMLRYKAGKYEIDASLFRA